MMTEQMRDPCPTCRGRTGRTSRDVDYDESRQAWVIYRGGWYTCPDCGGTGDAGGVRASLPYCAVCDRAGIETPATHRVTWLEEPHEHAVYGTGPATEEGENEYVCASCAAEVGDHGIVEPTGETVVIKRAQVAVGAAHEEGRAPTHDGEYVAIYYVPGMSVYAAEDGGGLAWTSLGEDSVIGDAYDQSEEAGAEMERQVAEARRAVAQDLGEPVEDGEMGSAAIECAREWGWC